MSYEFKSINDIEVVAEPTESANVLIEENGVIKKAPKTAVGGSNTLAIFFNSNNWVEEYNGNEILSAPDNLYETIDDMYQNSNYANIVAYNVYNKEDGQIDVLPLTYINKYDDHYNITLN